ncbi:MAG: nitrile hydratase subunit beta [Alphaproteobacteria bacterium]|jgi:nitrile hydratase|nr:nitrile hydratase subunit beta [Alphaproteobacteria bacterium]
MNGVHDMGGMDGMGPIDARPEAALFHAPWEARVLALTLAAGAQGRWTLDESRFHRESLPATDYLPMPYYGRWFAALTDLLVKQGLISAQELSSGRADPAAPRATPVNAKAMVARLNLGGPAHRPQVRPPRFAVGDKVRARHLNPPGHTRLPRYARGHVGVIARLHGVHVLPDSNAHGRGEDPQPLYQVRFDACELWGDRAQAPSLVHLDLWEPYLEPV